MEAAYLTIEKVQPKIGQLVIPNKITRRVFIVVSTSITDKHGEDTQSYGNLLFFGLDMARFENQEEGEGINEMKEKDDQKKDDPEYIQKKRESAKRYYLKRKELIKKANLNDMLEFIEKKME